MTRTSVQVEFRPLSVGCGGVELQSSDTLPKPDEKYLAESSRFCRLSKLFSLGFTSPWFLFASSVDVSRVVVVVYQLESLS